MYLLSGLVYVHEVYTDRMRSTYYPGVCTNPGTYYQGWFMYMRYTQGQNEEYVLSRSRYVRTYCTNNVLKFIVQCFSLGYSTAVPLHTVSAYLRMYVHILCLHAYVYFHIQDICTYVCTCIRTCISASQCMYGTNHL